MLPGMTTSTSFLDTQQRNPGPFFYPIAYLFRTTPAVLIGLVAAAALGWRRQWPLDVPVSRRSTLGLVVFALLFSGVMMLSDKKFDRYISPVFVTLDIVAALGWLGLIQAVLARWNRRQSRPAPAEAAPIRSTPGLFRGWAVVSAIFLLHGLFAFTHFPYYFTYYNPLVGGSRAAPQVLFVGWGEGLDAAADWLNQQPEAADSRIVSWYGKGPLTYFLKPENTTLSLFTATQLLDADYVVLYANQWQRGLPTPDSSVTTLVASRRTSCDQAGWSWRADLRCARHSPSGVIPDRHSKRCGLRRSDAIGRLSPRTTDPFPQRHWGRGTFPRRSRQGLALLTETDRCG